MKIGEVSINYDEFKKDYPILAKHMINEINPYYYEVLEEDNDYYDPEEKEIRIRVYYKNDVNQEQQAFTLLLHEKYITFKE